VTSYALASPGPTIIARVEARGCASGYSGVSSGYLAVRLDLKASTYSKKRFAQLAQEAHVCRSLAGS